MLKASECVLYSGGLRGAEAAFGALRRTPRHRGGELHLRRPRDRAHARRAHAQPRRAAARRRQPRLRLEADAPPLPRHRLHQEGAAEHLAPGEQRPGGLRRRQGARRRHGAWAAPAGAPSSPSCATSRVSSSIRTATAGATWTGTAWQARRHRRSHHPDPHFVRATPAARHSARRSTEQAAIAALVIAAARSRVDEAEGLTADAEPTTRT